MKPTKTVTIRVEIEGAGVSRIAAERQRQLTQEGWTLEHDRNYGRGTLAEAAIAYAIEGVARQWIPQVDNIPHSRPGTSNAHGWFPFTAEWWKPSEDPIRNLEKAGALIAAEIDRLMYERLTPDSEVDA